MTQGRLIEEVIQKARDADGQEISAVRCGDQTYGIARGGVLIESLRWPSSELKECLAFLERFAKTSQFDDPPPAVPPRDHA